MKKLMIVGALAMAFSFEGAAEQVYSSEDRHYVTPIELDLASPLQLPQWTPFSPWKVWGIRGDLIFGRSFCVYGIDVGISGYIYENMYGVQGTFFNIVNGDVAGVQAGVISNFIRGDVAGVQAAVALNRIAGEFAGVQAGLLNWDSGVCHGLQGGIANVAVNEFFGVSVGIVNIGARVHGFQCGLVNEIEQVGDGLQVGLINGAKEFTGVQIGLFNVIQNSELPIMAFVNAHF